MNGWIFAGWSFAALLLFFLVRNLSEHQKEVKSLEEEREVLWEQLEQWKPIVQEFAQQAETRARQAVTN